MAFLGPMSIVGFRAHVDSRRSRRILGTPFALTLFIYKVAPLIKSRQSQAGRAREENTVKIQQCFKLRGVNHAGQLDSVPYRARSGPEKSLLALL